MLRVGSPLTSLIDRASSIAGALAAMLLLGMMLLLITEVILRYGFNTSTLIADEVGAYALVALIYLALGHTLQKKQHIIIDVATSRLPLKTTRLLGRVVGLLNLPVFAILSWRAWSLVLDSYRMGSASQTILHTPQYLPQLAIPLGLSLLTIQGVLELLRSIAGPSPPAESRKTGEAV